MNATAHYPDQPSPARMWVKICGTTNLEDAQHAAAAGADALGFVFARSPRQVTVDQVRRIAHDLPRHPETFGVFVDAPVEEIVRTVLECGLRGVQLHHALQPNFVEGLRRSLTAHHAEATKIVGVFPFSDSLTRQLEDAANDLDAVLVDSRTALAAGGTGLSWDWAAGSPGFRAVEGKRRIIVAGGLNPFKVREAIETLRPWGVDVVTGVEAAPGRKDHRLVEAFIQAARNSVIADTQTQHQALSVG